MSLTLPAPAKLNLCLHILGRRPDGYHQLQTVFQLLDRGDTLSFAPRDDERLRLTPPLPGLAEEDNLVLRAARLLAPHAHTPAGADITLDKQLPAGGGLGGGSSDAATTLLALNHLWQCRLSEDELARLGLQLGADVPVFVRGHSAWAEGVGEQLSPLTLPEHWFVILTPPVTVATGEVFGHRDLTRDTAPITVAAFLERGGKNDCQPLVRKLYPDVDKALIWLKKFAANAKMSGTGASLFAAFDTEVEANHVREQVPTRWRAFVAQGINRSPTHRALANALD